MHGKDKILSLCKMAAASGWDTSRVFYHNTLGVPTSGNGANGTECSDSDILLRRKCLLFLENFRIEAQFPYRYVFNSTKCFIPSIKLFFNKIYQLIIYHTL